MGGLLRAELRKILSVRLWWGLLIPVLLLSIMINLFGGLFSAAFATDVGGPDPAPVVLASLAFALSLTSVFAALFGVVSAAGEFRHRTVTTTYLTAPGRGPVLLAKILTAGALGGVFATAAVLVGTVAGLVGQASARLPAFGALLAVAATGVAVCALWAAFGVALGTLVGNLAGVLAILLGYMLIGESIVSVLLNNSGSETVARTTAFLPGNAGDVALYDVPARVLVGPDFGASVIEGLAGVTAPPPWWGALLVLAAWTAAVAAAGWVVGERRDIT